MARSTPQTQAKRRREQLKKEKRRAKEERRAARKADRESNGTEPENAEQSITIADDANISESAQ